MTVGLSVLALACLATAQARAGDLPADVFAAAPGDEEQTLLFLGPVRPALIRLNIQVDGRGHRTRWDAHVRGLIPLLDGDGDGSLSRPEIARLDVLFRLPSRMDFPSAPARRSTGTDSDRFGASELADKVRLLAPPFSIQSESSPDTQGIDAFASLDRDKDGRLGRDEIAAAETSLQALDVDDDETVSARELAPYRNPFVGTTATIRGPAAPTDLVADSSPEGRARKILERYDDGASRPGASAPITPPDEGPPGASTPPPSRAGDGRLDRGEIVIDRAAFDRADLDGDGALDRNEIERGLATVPDVELILRIGRRDPSRPTVEFAGPVGARPGGVELVALGGDGAVIDLGAATIELRTSDDVRGQALASQRTFYLDQFRIADVDKDGIVNRDEVRKAPALDALHRTADRDGDGRLAEVELTSYLDLQAELTGLRIVLRAIDQGTSLLDLLDADRDRRIGVRELRALTGAIRREDRDGDGYVTPREVARHHRWVVALGEVPGTLRDPVVPSTRVATSTFPAPPSAPTWFLKMDRNRDGDLSPREFLGPEGAFASYDADGDGLISPAEARRAPPAAAGP